MDESIGYNYSYSGGVLTDAQYTLDIGCSPNVAGFSCYAYPFDEDQSHIQPLLDPLQDVDCDEARHCEVYCQARGSCSNITVDCPQSTGKECKIFCVGDLSCQAIIVNANGNSLLYLYSSVDSAFENSALFVSGVQRFECEVWGGELAFRNAKVRVSGLGVHETLHVNMAEALSHAAIAS